MNSFTVSTFDLSLQSSETGNPLTANVYRVDGIARELSISELVMAICLSRAAEVENNIIAQMEAMGRTTVNLETLTTIQTMLTKEMTENNHEKISEISGGNRWSYTPQWYDASGTLITKPVIYSYGDMKRFLTDVAGVTISSTTTMIAEVVTQTSSRVDTLNTTNQKDMINLQSWTNKRDQSYELITNMLKSINTVIMGNANNLSR